MLAAGLPVATGQFGLAQTERGRKRRKKRRKKKRSREESQRYCPTEETGKKRDELEEWEGGGE